MPLHLEKPMKKYDQRWMAARAWYTSGRTFDWQCPRCGAKGEAMPDKCSVPLEVSCPGFERLEEVHREFEANWQKMLATADSTD